MVTERLRRDDAFAALPPEYPRSLWAAISRSLAASGRLVLALDDDPTGTQTVHGIPVLTEWSDAALGRLFAEPTAVAYLLTNSRSLPPGRAAELNREIVTAISSASAASNRPFTLISRSDSTLRGHYPLEIDTLAECLAMRGHTVDGHVIVPYFAAGGRFTMNSVHYVAEGEWLVPAGETEYARDASFGYRSSYLPDWVSEKSGGRWAPEQVARITLHELRLGGPARISALLQGLHDNQPCVVDAVSDRDLEVLTAGMLTAEAQGKRLLARSAASFVRVRGAIAERGLLTRAEVLGESQGPGLVVAGSYISKSSEQIAHTLALPGVVGVELPVDQVLDPAANAAAVASAGAAVGQALRAGRVPLLYTSRGLRTGADAEASLAIGRQVSQALVAVVRAIDVRPAWIIAKGGITSSDVATQGLAIRRADVLGQILPGVPVWRAGAESRFPGVRYVVFPGNVGGPEAIAQLVGLLQGSGS